MNSFLLPKGKTGLIPFLVAGDPSLKDSFDFAAGLIEEGVSALEIGVPFSDPLADGPTIQRATERALKQNVTLTQVLEMVRALHAKHPQVPLVIFTYANPLVAMGFENYAKLAKASGVSATLLVDMPVEEAEELRLAHDQVDLKNVFLISPTTTVERAQMIAAASSGFVYYVTRAGTTGAQKQLPEDLLQNLRTLKKTVFAPIAAGFGISTGAQAAQLAGEVEGIVVGSAFVQLIEKAENPEQAGLQIRKLARELLDGIASGEKRKVQL